MSAFEGAARDEDVLSTFREGDCVSEKILSTRGVGVPKRGGVPKRVKVLKRGGVPKREGLESHTRRGVVEPKKGWITRGGVGVPKKEGLDYLWRGV